MSQEHVWLVLAWTRSNTHTDARDAFSFVLAVLEISCWAIKAVSEPYRASQLVGWLRSVQEKCACVCVCALRCCLEQKEEEGQRNVSHICLKMLIFRDKDYIYVHMWLMWCRLHDTNTQAVKQHVDRHLFSASLSGSPVRPGLIELASGSPSLAPLLRSHMATRCESSHNGTQSATVSLRLPLSASISLTPSVCHSSV